VSPGLSALGLDSAAILEAESSPQEWIHPDEAARWRGALLNSAATLDTLDEEVRVIGRDGRVRWVRSMGNPRRLGNGDVVWDGIALDVTDKREALDATRLAKEQADRAEAQKARLLANLSAVLEEPCRALKDWLAQADAAATRPADVLHQLTHAAAAIERAVALLHGTEDPVAIDDDPRLAGLTARQHDVLALLGEGQTNRQIATRLGLTEGTIKLHVRSVLRELGLSNRTQAAALAVRAGVSRDSERRT
jgi:DNA-binding NarL/FixJ family response regulator